MVPLKTGIDLIEIDRLADLSPRVRQRFLQRVFTPTELAQAGTSDVRLMGRFAAKEAVAKALGCGIGPVGWQEIEIIEGEAGQPVLRLNGRAQQMANHLGLTQWSISISHSRQHAVAVAVAIGPDGWTLENPP